MELSASPAVPPAGLPAARGYASAMAKDATVFELQPDTNLGSSSTIQCGLLSGFALRGLYESQDQVPAGLVSDATLTLHCNSASGTAHGANIELVDPADWTQAAVTWNNQPSPLAGLSDLVTAFALPTATGQQVYDVARLARHAIEERSEMPSLRLRRLDDLTAGDSDAAQYRSSEWGTPSERPVFTPTMATPSLASRLVSEFRLNGDGTDEQGANALIDAGGTVGYEAGHAGDGARFTGAGTAHLTDATPAGCDPSANPSGCIAVYMIALLPATPAGDGPLIWYGGTGTSIWDIAWDTESLVLTVQTNKSATVSVNADGLTTPGDVHEIYAYVESAGLIGLWVRNITQGGAWGFAGYADMGDAIATGAVPLNLGSDGGMYDADVRVDHVRLYDHRLTASERAAVLADVLASDSSSSGAGMSTLRLARAPRSARMPRVLRSGARMRTLRPRT